MQCMSAASILQLALIRGRMAQDGQSTYSATLATKAGKWPVAMAETIGHAQVSNLKSISNPLLIYYLYQGT